MNPTFRVSLLAGLALSLAAVSGCTVRPLMATPEVTANGVSASPALSSIAIAPVDTRYAQEVRNHLIFLFNGGAGQPASARYALDLSVTRTSSAAASVQVRTDNEPTSSLLSLTASYTLTESGTGQVLAKGRRQISSAYDVPRQEFAALRAARDAENRAARELAEQLRLAVGQDLARSDGGI